MQAIARIHEAGWVIQPVTEAADLLCPPPGVDILALPDQNNSFYGVGFAVSPRVVEEALRLRYEVFNLELNEGLMASHATGMDHDRFDDQMTHLVVIEKAFNRVVGTYRLQTARRALRGEGLYAAQEYDLSPMNPYFSHAVELGRACIAKNHRSLATLMLLWRGILAFMKLQRQRWMFGCCSLSTLDPDDGWRALKTLRTMGALEPFGDGRLIAPVKSYSCGDPALENDPDLGPGFKIPKLFRSYLRLGARVISQPAIDREFGAVDFLILLDQTRINVSILGNPGLAD